MRLQRFDTRYQLRLESGEQLVESLLRLLRAEGIGYAAINGLGAVRLARVAYWGAVRREYEAHELEEQLEVVSLVGNAALRDGAPALHLHVALGRRDLSLIGGHLVEAIAHPTVEVWLQPEQAAIVRQVDPDCRLPLMQLPDRLAE